MLVRVNRLVSKFPLSTSFWNVKDKTNSILVTKCLLVFPVVQNSCRCPRNHWVLLLARGSLVPLSPSFSRTTSSQMNHPSAIAILIPASFTCQISIREREDGILSTIPDIVHSVKVAIVAFCRFLFNCSVSDQVIRVVRFNWWLGGRRNCAAFASFENSKQVC